MQVCVDPFLCSSAFILRAVGCLKTSCCAFHRFRHNTACQKFVPDLHLQGISMQAIAHRIRFDRDLCMDGLSCPSRVVVRASGLKASRGAVDMPGPQRLPSSFVRAMRRMRNALHVSGWSGSIVLPSIRADRLWCSRRGGSQMRHDPPACCHDSPKSTGKHGTKKNAYFYAALA